MGLFVCFSVSELSGDILGSFLGWVERNVQPEVGTWLEASLVSGSICFVPFARSLRCPF